MRIHDERRRTAWMPVREVLEQVIPLLPVEHLVGVRRLVLLDEDYRQRKERAVGRYVPIPGTHAADIELYFDGYETLPLELRENRPLWAASLLSTLGHELYHHRIRGQRRRRRPSFDREQESADRWGGRYARDILVRVYPRERYRADYEAWQRSHESCQACSGRSAPGDDGRSTPP